MLNFRTVCTQDYNCQMNNISGNSFCSFGKECMQINSFSTHNVIYKMWDKMRWLIWHLEILHLKGKVQIDTHNGAHQSTGKIRAGRGECSCNCAYFPIPETKIIVTSYFQQCNVGASERFQGWLGANHQWQNIFQLCISFHLRQGMVTNGARLSLFSGWTAPSFRHNCHTLGAS